MKVSGTWLVIGLVVVGMFFAAATWFHYHQLNPTDPSARLLRRGEGWVVEATFAGISPRPGTRVVATTPEAPDQLMSGEIESVNPDGSVVVALKVPPPSDAQPGPCRATLDSATTPQ